MPPSVRPTTVSNARGHCISRCSCPDKKPASRLDGYQTLLVLFEGDSSTCVHTQAKTTITAKVPITNGAR